MKARSMGAAAVLGCLMTAGMAAWAQAPAAGEPQKDDLFAGTEKFSKGASESSEVDLDKNMLGATAAFAGSAAGFAKLDLVSVRSYGYPHAGMYSMADVEEIRKKLDDTECKHIVRTREKDGMTDVCVRTDHEGHWREMMVIDAENNELSFIHLKGAVSMDDLSRLGSLGAAQKAAPKAVPDPKLQHR